MDGQKEALRLAKEKHEGVMEGLKAELQAVRDKYDEELGLLDQESEFAKELKEIRREELEEKLKATDLSKKETLEIKEQLHQMDVKAKRQKLLAQKAAEEEALQKQIKETQAAQKEELDKIEESYKNRIKKLEESKQAEEDAITAINAGLETQREKVAALKNQELVAIYENKDAAIESLNEQIRLAGDLVQP